MLHKTAKDFAEELHTQNFEQGQNLVVVCKLQLGHPKQEQRGFGKQALRKMLLGELHMSVLAELHKIAKELRTGYTHTSQLTVEQLVELEVPLEEEPEVLPEGELEVQEVQQKMRPLVV